MRKERIIMLVSSVFVLTALTMTGFYVKEKSNAEKDGYVVDMSTLEKKTEDKTKEIAKSIEEEKNAEVSDAGGELDYDPNFQEASSGEVTNPWDMKKAETAGEEGVTADADNADNSQIEAADAGAAVNGMEEAANKEISAETAGDITGDGAGEAAKADGKTKEDTGKENTDAAKETASEAARALSFQEKDNLSWPVAGNVLINYSMDKTVYFPTLQQYRYSPAIVIAASEGENITASADGKVLSVFEDAQIGHAVTVDIGNGYELTYGQLDDISVMQGDVVSEGDVIGTVAAPTKYYSVEGANIYFKLTKDGSPVNPLSCLE